jgi:serine/threonine-protein kinase HipA
MRKAKIMMHDHWAGILTEDAEGYHFEYREEYFKNPEAEPVSLTLPLSDKKYDSAILFPFFDGLIPEGWVLDLGVKNWKINPRDRMKILLMACKDCIGAVSVSEMD